MTAAVYVDSTEAPPELPRIATFPMRSQSRPLRVVYAVPSDAFACAALSDALAAAVADGVGMALSLDALLPERSAVGTAAVPAGVMRNGECGRNGAGAAVDAAVFGHSLSSE